MNKSRLEAFSDGVFAIAITLLVLNIRIPDVPYSQLPQALFHALPSISTYVMSFVVIGIYWISHHQSSQYLEKTNRVLLWLNLFLLMLVSFMPFPTSLLGRYPFKEIPVMIYGINLIAANLTGFIILLYVYYHKDLASPKFTKEALKKQLPVYISVNAIYFIAILLSFFAPLISYLIYAGVLVILIFFLSLTRN